MKRRDVIAGVASVGTLVGSAALLRNGPPTFGDDPQSNAGNNANDGPTEVQTIDAGPSDAGTQELPVEDQVSVINFFVTYCGYCKRQMGPLAEARERTDDDVRFLSVTTQSLDNALDEDELREWWDEHDGTWDVGHGSTRDFRREHNVLGFPVTLVIDEDGEAELNEGSQVISADGIVDAVEAARDDSTGEDADVDGNDGNESDDSTGEDADADGNDGNESDDGTGEDADVDDTVA